MPKPYFNKIEIIREMVRVNHAGEYSAQQIYKKQIQCNKHHVIKDLLHEMYRTESKHLDFFNKMLQEVNVKATIFLPLWQIFSNILGLSSLFSIKHTMLVTLAIEEVINVHYEEQLEILKKFLPDNNVILLQQKIKEFKNDEINHEEQARKLICSMNALDTIVYQIIKQSCKIAIILSKKI